MTALAGARLTPHITNSMTEITENHISNNRIHKCGTISPNNGGSKPPPYAILTAVNLYTLSSITTNTR